MKTTALIAAMTLSLVAGASFAQTAASTVQRDVNQETRIEQGLKSGQLNTREAARLEREESKVDRLQSQALKDGKLTPAEQARLKAAQDRTSQDIYAAKHNDVKGNPQSASSQRMQADVQRNVNQQQRIENGVKNGSLTNHEVAKLEHGQARVAGKEARAGRDGHVGAAAQANVQHAENHQSRRIFKQKHDAQVRGEKS
jgi:hypothetical protein